MEEKMNKELLKYIKEQIIPQYELNGKAHGVDHVETVLKRADEISELYENLDFNILFTAVAFHDIGDHIDRKHHEIVSAQIMMEDEFLNKFFTAEEKIIIKEAIEDHRSSNGRIPRSIYGKILASADKNVDVEVFFSRTLEYGKEHYPELNKEQQIERAYEHAINKFGVEGYAVDMYFVDDNKYNEYLEKLQALVKNKEEFYKTANEVMKKL